MSKFLGYEKEIKDKSILCMQLNLLNKCTSRCQSCRKYTWPNDELKIDDVKNVIKWFANQGGKSIIISGGDPILYKDLDKVIETISYYGIKWSIFSTLITKNKDLLTLIGKKADRLHISVDAVDKELYKNIRGVDAWDLVKENLIYVQSLRTNKIPIRLSCTITALNYEEWLHIYEFAKENSMLLKYYPAQHWVNDSEKYFETGIGFDDNISYLFNNRMKMLSEIEKKSGKIITNANQLVHDYYNITSNNCKKCYIPFVHTSINSNGDLYYCCKCLDDNGFYGKQTKFVYGNICNKTQEELSKEFAKRFNKNCKIERECYYRYGYEVINDLENIFESNRRDIYL